MFDSTNQIDITAQLHPNLKLGKYNRIGKNVIIDVFRGVSNPHIEIGDNNIINDNTRILVGEGGFLMLDWNVLHNDMLLMAESKMIIGSNCWFGQNTILDASGGLTIGNGVRVGMYSQIWTHVASGELLEGCTLFAKRETIIEDDVWLVGSCVVSSGLKLGRKSICLINSVLTKDTEPERAYAGAPAKLMEKAVFWRPITVDEKFDMIFQWANDYAKLNPQIMVVKLTNNLVEIEDISKSEKLKFALDFSSEDKAGVTEFSLSNKSFKKKNTELERSFYKFIYNYKARFVPVR
jgi:acetyltransferase-like isoleucine patch superfamily enzyme